MEVVPLPPADLDIPGDPTAQVLAWCERGRDALASAENLAEGRDVLGATSTLEHAVRVRNLNSEAVVAASALRLRAERRVGELIREEREAGRLATRETGGAVLGGRPTLVEGGDKGLATLADHHISRDRAAEFSRLAEVPEETFEEALEEAAAEAKETGAAVSRGGVLRRLAALPTDLADRAREGLSLDEAESVQRQRDERLAVWAENIRASLRTVGRMAGYPVPVDIQEALGPETTVVLVKVLTALEGEDLGFLG